MVDQTLLIFGAAVLGVGTRTLVKYLEKVIEGSITSFDTKFIASAILSVIIVIVSSMGFVLGFQIPPNATTDTLLVFSVFWESYGVNDLVNIPVNRTVEKA